MENAPIDRSPVTVMVIGLSSKLAGIKLRAMQGVEKILRRFPR